MTYVKKRIYKDSIEYICLPNQAKTNLRTAREDFFKLVNDLNNLSQNNTSKKQNSTNTKPFSFDALAFEPNHSKYLFIALIKNNYSFYTKDILPNPYHQSLTPPPNYFI